MKLVLNLILALISAGLIYLLVETIRKPIDFKNTRKLRETSVQSRLKTIGDLQKMHKDLKDIYANNFDSLKQVLITDTFFIEKVVGDPNDTTQSVERVIVAVPSSDSLQGYITAKDLKYTSVDEMFATIRKVPFAKDNTTDFKMEISEAIVDGTDSMKTPTFVVKTSIGTYMHEYDSASYVIYDPDYNPKKVRKIGDLYKPTTSGNW
jgi:hypothetical protein